MSDFTEHVANLAAGFTQDNQPWTDMVNERMQRIQELEQIRRDRFSNSSNGNNLAEGRHARRDRIVHVTSRPERRGNIPRAPIRSQSFDVDFQPRTESFRDILENTNFGSPMSGSSDNVADMYLRRRDSDTNLAQKVLGQIGSDSGSDSSLSNSIGNRRDLLGSDNSLNREPRSSSITRERRDTSVGRRRMRTPNITGETSLASRILASRESRSRDSRRRRTIQGSDRNVVEALEREKVKYEPFASRLSPSFPALSDTDLSTETDKPKPQIENGRSFNSEKSYYRPQSSYKRKVIVNQEDTVPVIAFEGEKVIFVHSNGKTFWLNKTHPLMRYFNTNSTLPDIVINPPKTRNEEVGIIESIDGEPEERLDRVREVCNIPKKGEDEEDTEPLPTGDEERYQPRTLYTPPRERPSIDNYFSTRHVISLYDGIDMTVFEVGGDDKETDTSDTFNETEHLAMVNRYDIGSTRVVHRETSAPTNTSPSNNMSNEREQVNSDNSEANENEIDDDTNSPVNDIRGANEQFDDRNSSESTVVTQDQFSNDPGDIPVHNQRLSMRQSVIEHRRETHEDEFETDTNTYHPSVEQNDQMMNYLEMVHESSGVPLDTSHLDYEELQMIQKALAENPSPSPPSSPAPSPSLETDQHYPLPPRESVVARPELGTILESPGRLQLPSLDFSPMDKNKDEGNFTFSPTSLERNQSKEGTERSDSVFTEKSDQEPAKDSQSSDCVSHNSEPVSTQRLEPDSSQSLEPAENVEQVSTHISENPPEEESEDEENFSYTEEFTQEVIIPFPHSPNSPFKSPNSASSSQGNNFFLTRSGHHGYNTNPLDIEIPGDSSEVGHTENPSKTLSCYHSNSSDVSPLVKSEKSSGGVSPEGSETVSTVFEEFVSNIPNEMLNNWQS